MLALCFTLYTMSVPLTWAVYYLYADRIAGTYCVNRDDPSCHGRCHIRAVTGAQEKPTAPSAPRYLQEPLPFLISENSLSLVPPCVVPFDPTGAAGIADGVPKEIEPPPNLRISPLPFS